MRSEQAAASPSGVARRLGRYVLFDEIASGGMAVVHLGRLRGSVGFARTVAIKRLHPQYARDPEFVSMFTDEARLAARIRHPNVAATLDVVTAAGELFLVMEYIHGESLAKLLRVMTSRKGRVPVPIAVGVAVGTLLGLHAAHEAKSESGEPLGVVHRDVSPQNIMVGTDGVARVLDFGVAKAVGRLQTTREGELKGKTAYMAPEQLGGKHVDRRADVYAVSVVLWETLAGRRLFIADTPTEILAQVVLADVPPPSRHAPDVSPDLDAIVMRGLDRNPSKRYATAMEMALALEHAVPPPTARQVGRWVEETAREVLAARAVRLQHIEQYGVDVVTDAIEVEDAVSALGTTPAGHDEAPSDFLPSRVSSVTGARPPSAPGRGWQLIAVAATAIAATAVGYSVVSHRLSDERKAAAAAAPPSLPPAAAPPSASPPAASSSTEQAPPASSEATAPTIQSAAAAATVNSAARPPPRRKAPAKTSSSPQPQCDPPYIIDRDGIHIPKPECG